MKHVDQAPCITVKQFRGVAKREGWTVDSLTALVKGELDEPKRTIERILKTSPADTVIPCPEDRSPRNNSPACAIFTIEPAKRCPATAPPRPALGAQAARGTPGLGVGR